MPNDTVTIYDLEIDQEEWNKLTSKLEDLDSSRKYSKKHRARQAIHLASELLAQEQEQINRSLTESEKRINELKQMVKPE
jgi:hypothetical protein